MNIYELLNIILVTKNLVHIYIKENNNDQIEYDNYIIGEINVLEENINKSTRIIGSFEECKREKKWKDEEKYNGMENEKEIKENCIIEINNKVIPFSYFYKFNDTGKYKIKYSFIKNLKNLNYLFFNCRNLININFENFNAQNITNMSGIFEGCENLLSIDFLILILKMLLIWGKFSGIAKI